jgi:hypothetical protein
LLLAQGQLPLTGLFTLTHRLFAKHVKLFSNFFSFITLLTAQFVTKEVNAIFKKKREHLVPIVAVGVNLSEE